MKPKLSRILTYTLLLLGAGLLALPLIWMVLTALKPADQALSNPPTWVPHRWTTAYEGDVVQVGVGTLPDDVTGSTPVSVQLVQQWQLEAGGGWVPVRLLPSAAALPGVPETDDVLIQLSVRLLVNLDAETIDAMPIPERKRQLAKGWLMGRDLPVRVVEDEGDPPGEGRVTCAFYRADGTYLLRLPVPESMLRTVYNTTQDQADASYSTAETRKIARADLRQATLPWDEHERIPFEVTAAIEVPYETLTKSIDPRFENFGRSIDEMGTFRTYLFNTLALCFLTVIGTVISSALVAYGFSRIDWPGRDKLFGVVLATMMIPFPVLMVPLYALFRELGWVGTLRPLWVPFFFAGAFNVFLLRQFFLTIPRDMTEAARIDGCSELRIFLQIVVPLAKPALMVVALFQFMATWNDFLGPIIYLTDQEDFTLALGLLRFQSQHGGTPWHLLMAASTLITLPVIVLFFFTQRSFIEGISMTGSKG